VKTLIAFLLLSVPFTKSLEANHVPTHEYSEEEITWLAQNVYFEARNQGVAGQLAVAMVTMNRVRDPRFPNTIKEVVLEAVTYKNGHPVRNRCQFSWYCDGKSDKIYDYETFNKVRNLILTYIQNRDIMIDITEGATFYHADYVNPSWNKVKEKTIEIEDHIFYRWN
jgi:spore germination cell wall hydrolase CwlJ-like protein